MGEPRPTGYVLVVGPDGSGKTTVVDEIIRQAAERGSATRHYHSRPHLVAAREATGTVTDPHAQSPRPVLASLVKLAVVWLDHVLGGLLRWRRERVRGLLLVERGWYDMVVDPRRYRLTPGLASAARLLGRLLLRPDIVVVLSGDPGILHARKPEIGEQEVALQLGRWRAVAPRAGRRTVDVDTTALTPADAGRAVLDALAVRPASVWRSVPMTPGRVALRSTGRASAAMVIYHPFSRRAQVGALVGRRMAGIAGRRTSGPVLDLSELSTLVGFRPDGAVAMQSSTPGRQIIGLCRNGEVAAIVKVGHLDDERLRNEASMLTTPLRADLPMARPEVLWGGAWHDHMVLVTRSVCRVPSRLWRLDEVLPLLTSLATAGPGGEPLVHGDVTPWNLLRTAGGPVLVDWEFSRWADEPLHDLTHFVFQEGALLGRYTPEAAISLLCAPGSVGAHMLGERAALAPALLRRYLRDDAFRIEERARRYASRLEALLDGPPETFHNSPPRRAVV